MRVHLIFLSHFHADHVLGLPGLIATMAMHERDTPLHIFGPREVKKEIEKVMGLALMKKNFEIRVKEVGEGEVLAGEKLSVSSVPLKHGVKCLGYE